MPPMQQPWRACVSAAQHSRACGEAGHPNWRTALTGLLLAAGQQMVMVLCSCLWGGNPG